MAQLKAANNYRNYVMRCARSHACDGKHASASIEA